MESRTTAVTAEHSAPSMNSLGQFSLEEWPKSKQHPFSSISGFQPNSHFSTIHLVARSLL